MAAKRSSSPLNGFWQFVEDNPKLAADLAFQVGYWAGKAVDDVKALKGAGKKMAQLRTMLPPGFAEAALRLLPSPALQPHGPKSNGRSARKSKRVKSN